MNQSTLKSLRVNLRLSENNEDFDNEIVELTEACKFDLKVAGVGLVDETNPLTLQALKYYCRANFEKGDPTERELYDRRYRALRDTMAESYLFNEGGSV